MEYTEDLIATQQIRTFQVGAVCKEGTKEPESVGVCINKYGFAIAPDDAYQIAIRILAILHDYFPEVKR